MHEQPDVSRDSTTVASQTLAHRHGCCAPTAADSRSDRPMQRSATHSNAATQQHSNTRSLPHTAANGDQGETYTETPKHAAPQLHTPLHCTLNVLVSTVVTHNGGAASHAPTTPSSSVQRSHSRKHTQHFHHGVTVAVGSYTTAMQRKTDKNTAQDTSRTSA